MAEKTLFNEWTNVVAEGRNDLVFEYKHKDYGAYQIRRTYNRTVFIALTITALSFLFAISIPTILDWINSHKEDAVQAVDITSADLTPPPIDPTEPPPPPPPPPPVIPTIAFTPPVVTDEKVEDVPPVITEETPQISTETHEGTGDQDIVIPDAGTGNQVVEPADDQIFTIVEQNASFPGGEEALYKYLQSNIHYPEMEHQAGIQGTCYLKFVVEKDGSITDVTVGRGVAGGPGCDKEAIRVVKSMPKWKPAKQGGREVRVYYSIPIKFRLN